jgi:cyanophycinase
MPGMRPLLIRLLFVTLLPLSVTAQSPGPIVAVGGGGTTDAIVQRTLELAGGKEARVVVLPQASALANAGDSSVRMWTDAGARSSRKVSFDDPGAKAALEQATLIWIPGGDQNRFMKAITGTGLDDVIRSCHRAGAVVGGTSAGAAVLSERMITGEADLQSLKARSTVLGRGLGLWTGGIFDQHFLRRQRGNRLLSAVLDNPHLVGVGIDEATAVILRAGQLEVVGRSAALVLDARQATITNAPASDVVGATGLRAAVLREGMTLTIDAADAARQP